jgi:myosin heavy subunit
VCKSKIDQSEAFNNGLKKQLDEFKINLQKSVAFNNDLKKKLNEFKIKLQESEAVKNDLNKKLDESKIKLQESEAVNNDLNKKIDESKIKLQESGVVKNDLKKKLDESKIKLQQSEEVISGLKNLVKDQEEILKGKNETKKELQTTIDYLKKTEESLIQKIQEFCYPPVLVSTCNIAVFTLSKRTEISVIFCKENVLQILMFRKPFINPSSVFVLKIFISCSCPPGSKANFISHKNIILNKAVFRVA